MTTSPTSRIRLTVEGLEDRRAPATLTITPYIEQDNLVVVREVTPSAKPGLTTAQAHTGGLVQWSLANPA
jgi:hypothetical protein